MTEFFKDLNPNEYPDFIDKINSGLMGIRNIQETFSREGFFVTNFGFNIARLRPGLDLIAGKKRYLIYHDNPLAHSTYRLFREKRLPIFEEVTSSPDNSTSVIEIPAQTRALDSIQFPEQGFSQSHLGAFEIMSKIGEFLAKIQKETGQLPNNINLSTIALTTGQEDFIKLLPPFTISPGVTIDEITETLLQDMNLQDPMHDRRSQIKVLKERFILELNRNYD